MPAPDPKPVSKKDAVDPSLLAETLADAPAIRGSRAEQAAPADPGLDDTAVDFGAPRATTSPGRSADHDPALEDIFDKPDAVADASSLTRFDPERGKTSVAIKVRAVTQAVRNTITTPFGKLLLAIIFGLAGVTLTIAAVTLRDTPYVIAAILVTPIGALLVYWRYQAWLGHKRYMYRLLETLGEDVSEFDPRRIYRRAGTTGTTSKKRR